MKIEDVFKPKQLLRSGKANGNGQESYLYFNLYGSWANGRGVPPLMRTQTYVLESQGPDRVQPEPDGL